MGIVRKGVESLVPGGALIGAGVEGSANFGKKMLRHPVLSLGAVAVLVGGGLGAYEGIKMNFELETEATTLDEGRGEIIAVDLDIEEKPLVGFTADVTGAKTILANKLTIGIKPVAVTLPAGSNWVTLDQRIPTTINYDPSKITSQYDPGKIDDESDDRIILNVPLDAFSVENTTNADTILAEDYEFTGDLFSYPEAAVALVTEKIDQFNKYVPLAGDIKANVSEKEKTLLATTKIGMMNNVIDVCAPKFMENETVNKAMHTNLANAVFEAVGKSEDPEIIAMRKNVDDWATMDVDVFIGAESDAQPTIIGQDLKITNPYAEQMAAFAKNPDLKLETSGNFECELSDEVKELLGVEDEPTASPSATSEAKDE